MTSQQIKDLRKKTGLSQPEFAEKYNIPVGNIKNWEQGRREPDKRYSERLKEISDNIKI